MRKAPDSNHFLPHFLAKESFMNILCRLQSENQERTEHHAAYHPCGIRENLFQRLFQCRPETTDFSRRTVAESQLFFLYRAFRSHDPVSAISRTRKIGSRILGSGFQKIKIQYKKLKS